MNSQDPDVQVSTPVLEFSERYVHRLFDEAPLKNNHFHNLKHTQEVAEAVTIIGSHCDIDEGTMEEILIAAWFHDIAFAYSSSGKEELSCKIARKALENWGCEHRKIEIIQQCIDATKMPQAPNNLKEKIICDADLFHLSDEEYFAKNALLRKEVSSKENQLFSDLEWFTMNLKFLTNHRYFTPYGQSVLEKKKHLNILKNIEILNALQE
jgi:uncharacterized protein